MNNFLQPAWPAPKNVHAYTSLKSSGISRPPVLKLDRERIQAELQLPNEPIWLQQIHSNIVVKADPKHRDADGDSSFATESNQVCIIQTADCLPILICDKIGTQVAAIHAGWRGLAKNIIHETIQKLTGPRSELLAWIGPAISQPHFEVGEEVLSTFLQLDPENEPAFIPSPNQRWLADLYAIATLQLKKLGINAVYGKDRCTFSEKEYFFSYRRDGKDTGRIASLIWMS